MGDRHAIRRLTAALVAVLALAGCGGDDQASGADVQEGPTAASVPSEPVAPPTPTPSEPEPAPTTEPAPAAPAPDTPPENVDEFDAAYVEAVMAELDELLGDSARILATNDGVIDEEFQRRMRALYSPNTASAQISSWERVGADLLSEDPDDPTTDVLEVVSGSPECIFFSAERRYDPMLSEPLGAVQPYWLRLVPNEPNPLNRTPWMIDLDSFYEDSDARPGDRCTEV